MIVGEITALPAFFQVSQCLRLVHTGYNPHPLQHMKHKRSVQFSVCPGSQLYTTLYHAITEFQQS